MTGKLEGGSALLAHAAASRDAVIRRLREAMRTIERELDLAGGLYPRGKLTQAELCRRASVRQATLQKRTHRDSTLREVNAWLGRVAIAIRTSKSVKAAVFARVESLRDANAALMQRYHEAELELIDARSEMDRLTSRVEELEESHRRGIAERNDRITSIAEARRRTRKS